MNNLRSRSALVIGAAMTALALAACDNRDAGTAKAERNVDAAVEKTTDATVAAAKKAAELAEKARDNTTAFFKSPEVKQDVATAKDALKNAGTALSSTVDDATIKASVTAELARDPDLSARRIDVASNAGTVRLSGPAPSAEAKARAETLARAVKGVSSVDNRLEVGAVN